MKVAYNIACVIYGLSLLIWPVFAGFAIMALDGGVTALIFVTLSYPISVIVGLVFAGHIMYSFNSKETTFQSKTEFDEYWKEKDATMKRFRIFLLLPAFHIGVFILFIVIEAVFSH